MTPFAATNTAAAYTTNNLYMTRGTCNEGNFISVTGGTNLVPDTAQNAAWTSIFQDQLTGTYFTNILATGVKWTVAIDGCAALNAGSHTGGTGWYLPTQREFTQIYIDGISRLGTTTANSFGDPNGTAWSSTMYAAAPENVYFLALGYGVVKASLTRGGSAGYLCIRQ